MLRLRSALWRWVVPAAVLPAVLLTTAGACARFLPGEPYPEGALRILPDGRAEVIMLPCRSGRILAAGMAEWQSVDSDERRVWQITLDPASALRAVPLGAAPDGARVDVPFDGAFRPGYQYTAWLRIDGKGLGAPAVSFAPGDLAAGPGVFFDGRRYTEQDFDKEARRACKANV